MWICLNNAFLSIVADRNDKSRLLVRARVAGHIEAVFPNAKVFTDAGADYFYRAFVDRKIVADFIALEIDAIDYPNFKNSVVDSQLHDAYAGFWTIMYRLQAALRRKPAVKPGPKKSASKVVRVAREHLPID